MILGLFGGYLFSSAFRGGDLDANSNADILIEDFGENEKEATLEDFSKLSFDFSILDYKSFKSLRIIGDPDINPGIAGRSNIFSPF